MRRIIYIIIVFAICLNSSSYGFRCNRFARRIYHIKITDGNASAYELLTFHRGGLVSIIHNIQDNHTFPNSSLVQSSTPETGEWICTGKNQIYAYTFGYNYEVPGVLSSVSYNQMYLSFKAGGEIVKGNCTIAFYRLGDDPTNANSQPIDGQSYGPYTIVGRQWTKRTSDGHLYFHFYWHILYTSFSCFLLLVMTLKNY